MRRSLKLALIVIAPVAALAGAVIAGRSAGWFDVGAAMPGAFDYVQRIELPDGGALVGLPAISGPPDASRPLVVIDAGHGGHDPGAGLPPIQEKQLTLMLAKALREELLNEGGIRVALTRDDDRYLMLDERSGIARRLRADLFLSIHADSVEDGAQASGASVYTLSERGTNETAARIAARENDADTINGVRLAGKSDSVSAILVDLSQRETQARSEDFARLILREARGTFDLHDDDVQSAAFVVLKSPDLPSVLFEAGYISNPAEAARLASAQGRQAFAQAAARAIRVYFARHSGQTGASAPSALRTMSPGGT